MGFSLSEDQLKELEKHIGGRARSLKFHERCLTKEISKGAKQTAFHTISRHGFQTGWEAQLVRLMTGETPDQPFALNGVRGHILEWQRGSAEVAQLPARTRNIRYASADSVGAFLGPEMETEAIRFAALRTKQLQAARFAEMETGPVHSRVKKWEKFKYIEIVAKTRFDFCGVSFVLKTKGSRPSREVFEDALNDYLTGGLGLTGKDVSLHDEMLYRQAKQNGSEFPPGLKKKMGTRFPNLSDLLDFLGVVPVMMKHIRLVLKRVPETSLTWKLHTAYAVNDPPLLRPDAPGSWTGRVKDSEDGPPRMLDKNMA